MSDWVHIEVEEIIRETDLAFYVRCEHGREWIPKSQIAPADLKGLKEGDTNLSLCITKWCANQKNLS